jgi:g-D-glutamyl-meso-diaminopimelate peptidase
LRKFYIFLFLIVFLVSGMFDGTNIAKASSIVNPNQVYSYTKMVSDIQKLKSAYPDLIKVKVIGKSEYGRDLYAVALGKGSANVFINGSHHAREWMTTTLNMVMIEKYAYAYQHNQKINGYDVRKILNSTTIWFVPMVNPDGVTLQQEGLKAFPKSLHASLIKMNEGSTNFKRWKANAKGVDLNLQYDAGWKSLKGPKGPSYKNYKGKAPHTAAETKAIVKFINEINPEMTVAYHSSGQILYWYYKQSSGNYKRDYAYAKQIGKMTGYSLVPAVKNPSGGGLTDWFIQTKKRPGFTPEIAKFYPETSPPLSEFAGTWRENQAVGLYVAQESWKLYDARQAKVAADLKVKIDKLKNTSKKLKTYYFTNIKTEKDLKVEKNFTNLYNSVNKESKNLGNQVAKLPNKHRKKLKETLNEIQTYLNHSANYMAGIKAGENLETLQESLIDRMVNGLLDSKTIEMHNLLANTIDTSADTIGEIYGKQVRTLTSNKFVLPAKITKENTMYELSRYTLTLQMKEQVKARQIDLVKQNLLKLEKLETDSKLWKEKGNKLHPGKYYQFPKTEKVLMDKKNWILSQLKKLEGPTEQPANSSQIEAEKQNEQAKTQDVTTTPY